MTNSGDPADLRAENARLVALLESHGIEWRRGATVDVPLTPSALSTDQKIALFRRLFRGRTDVYPVLGSPCAGKAKPARLGTRQRAPTNGVRASARSRGSSVQTVIAAT